MSAESLKVVLCGNNHVGKRSLVHRWTKGEFAALDNQQSYAKRLHIGSRSVSVTLRAIKAEDFYNSSSTIGKAFFAEVDGIAFVYDMTDQKSLSVMAFWLEQISRKVTGEFPVIFLIGNKCEDSIGSNSVRPKAVKKIFTTEHRLRACHIVSAKTGENVDAAFRHLTACCLITKLSSDKLKYLVPSFMLKAISKIGSKIRLKYESNSSNSPFDGILEGLDPNSTVSPQAFIRSRLADELPSLLDSSRFLTLLQLAVKTNTLPVAKVALKCFQKFVAYGYLEAHIEIAEEWVKVISQSLTLIDAAQYQRLLAEVVLTVITSLRGYRYETVITSFAVCYHMCVVSNENLEEYLMSIIKASVPRNTIPLSVKHITAPVTFCLQSKAQSHVAGTGVELLISYLDRIPPSPSVHKKSQLDNLNPVETSQPFGLFESCCWLSTGYNKFVKVKGLPPYKHKSKVVFLNLINGILKNLDCALDLFLSFRETFHMALVESGIWSQTEFLERLFAFTNLSLEKLGPVVKFKVEIGAMLKVLFFVLESPNAPSEHKMSVLKMLVDLSSQQQHLLELFIHFDCDIRHQNLFQRVMTLLCQITDSRSQLPIFMAQSARIPEEDISTFKRTCLKNIVAFLKFLSSKSRPKRKSRHDISGIFAIERQKKLIWNDCIELFNRNPLQGIRFLQKDNLIGSMPEDVVKVLLMETRFDRSAVGEFLGNPDPFCISVLERIFESFDFSNVGFVQALRKIFLHGFRLPGEAQKIDRIMERFSLRYFQCASSDKDKIANAGAAHPLAFSVIMLNTDLHSSTLRQHMTKESFVKNLRGMNDGQDFSKEFLNKIYDEIAAEKLAVTLSMAEIVRQTPTQTVQTSRPLAARIQQQQHMALLYEGEMELLRLATTAFLHVFNLKSKSTENESSVKVEIDHGDPPVCIIQAMFETSWRTFFPVMKTCLETGDDDVAGSCIDAMHYSLILANEFNEKEIFETCIEMLSFYCEKTASVSFSESTLNLIAALGGREFISSFLRSSERLALKSKKVMNSKPTWTTWTKNDSYNPAPIYEGADCAQLLSDFYGVEVESLTAMDGMVDLSLHVIDNVGNQFTFKIFRNPALDICLIEAEILLLQFLYSHGLPVPKQIATKKGKLFEEAKFPGSNTSKYFRLQTYIEGSLLKGKCVTVDLCRQAGELTAMIDCRLAKFGSHCYDSRTNLAVIMKHFASELDTRQLVSELPDEAQRELGNSYLRLYDDYIDKKKEDLPIQITHGDLHGRNLIVSRERSNVVGVIDFTDAVKTFRIIDPAFVVGDLLLSDNDVVNRVEAYMEGYVKHVNLTDAEKQALPIAAVGRLIQIVALSNNLKKTLPGYDATYLESEVKPTLVWSFTESLITGQGDIGRLFATLRGK